MIRATFFVALLVFSLFASAESVQNKLIKTFTPITSGAVKGSLWVTVESQLVVPSKLEDQLMIYFIESWNRNDFPESYEQLSTNFASLDTEDSGYPLVDSKGEINPSAADYWIQKQMEFNRARNNSQVSYVLNSSKSTVDETTGLVTLVYREKFQINPDEQGKIPEQLTSALPKNLVATYVHILGAQDLWAKGVNFLAEKQLPQPRLVWRDKLTNVKNRCLGQDGVSGILTFSEFLSAFSPLESKCYLSDSLLTQTTVLNKQAPPKDVVVYPEYHELFKDNKLSVLISLQQCNDKNSACNSGNLNEVETLRQLDLDLKDVGYKVTNKSENVTYYNRTEDGLTVELMLLRQKRPAIYEDTFWELYPKAELIITNRVPIQSEHFNKAYVPQYQIVVANNVEHLAWGRILPTLDYEMDNFDAVDVNVTNASRSQVLQFIGSFTQASQLYKGTKADLVKHDWKSLIDIWKTNVQDRSVDAVAEYVRSNNFVPGAAKQEEVNFSTQPDTASYVQLLNINGTDTEVENPTDYRLAYLYLTLHEGDRAANFNELRKNLQTICGALDNHDVKYLYFYKNCAPRSLLTSEKTSIQGINFSRGSYLRLYHSNEGKINFAYLSENTKIGDFVFKPYFQDTAGAVKFDQKTGKVESGHLGVHTDYKGLPLLGGRGTSMLRFYPDGTLKTARLRQNTDYAVNVRDAEGRVTSIYNIKLRGGSYAPHMVSFHPNGNLECGYLAASSQTIGNLTIAGVTEYLGLPVASKGERKVCFHPNGKLMSGVLSTPYKRNNVDYPVGTKVVLDFDGEISSPQFKIIKAGQSFWGSKFPEGSLYTVDAKGNPEWIKLAGDLSMKEGIHWFPAGSEVTFTKTGFFTKVKAPTSGTQMPKIKLETYTFTVPINSTLLFSRYGDSSPEELIFTEPVTIAGITYLPVAKDQDGRTLSFHSTGRVASGIIASDVDFKDDHYGIVPLKNGTEVRFTEEGGLEEATLARDTTLTYAILTEDQIPSDGKYKKGNGLGQLEPINLPAGSVLEFQSDSKINRVTLAAAWKNEQLSMGKGSVLNFNDSHTVTSLTISSEGGQVGAYSVAKGNVKFYANGWPQAIVLSQPTEVNGIQAPAGAGISFFESKKLKQVSSDENSDFALEYEGRKFTREISFYESGKIKTAYLKEDVDFGGILLASLTTCRQLRNENSKEAPTSCAVSFYKDGVTFMEAVSAAARPDKNISAGQPVEFLEDGTLYLE